ncbi:HAD-IA family hydrolase [Persephonella atlantica]|uniref:phosphoglycolate phosphatase n=1 Tax=Persephonella atlantica TaxID=2699429 RepID=A0ABS1GFV6_9AQUI|nr:HAD-IA family hydrolase [Persephonella atlantica]MBK3331803.1 HAD-IA family hydrolase [Persephonella atlantica]
MDRQSVRKISGIQAEIKNKDTFLFDLDGTLINSSKDIAVAVNYALKKLGFPALEEKEIIKHVGYGGKKLIEGVLKTDDNELIEEGVRLFREYYFSNPAVYTTLYPYVYETLELLKKEKKKVAVVTNKYQDISEQILKKLNIVHLIDLIVGGDTTPSKKPEREPVMFALKNLNSNPENAVMIGDSEADVQAGRSAGVKTVFVTYGFGKEDKVLPLKPDFIINSMRQLLW